MDPARLAEIEAAWKVVGLGSIDAAVVIHELIAEIRRLNEELER